MKIVFIDASPTMIAKNLLPIASQIFCINNQIQFIFVSLEISSNIDSNMEKDSINQIKELPHSSYYILKSFAPAGIDSFLKQQLPGIIILGAYRIFDMLWSLIAKRRGIRVFNFQHGFEVNSVYYKPYIMISKMNKSFRMLYALYYLSKLMQKNYLQMLSQFSQYFFKGKKLNNSYFDNKVLKPDHVFIYSEYYRDFWNKKFGLNPQYMSVIGPPDLMIVNEIRKKPKINGCCYLTQTLVEDGRMTKVEFNSLLNEYKIIAKRYENFIIKIHPRGNKDLYYELATLKNVKLMREFPNCDYYLTHYSSTAFVAYYISPKIVLHELKGHATPDIFLSSGFKTVNTVGDILKSFDNHFDYSSEQKKFIDKFSPLPTRNPYNLVAKTVVENLARQNKLVSLA